MWRGLAQARFGLGHLVETDAALRQVARLAGAPLPEGRLGLGWAKSLAFTTGQCPVMRYNRQLMMAILHDRVTIAKNVNATPIPLEQAPDGYAAFDHGAARKYVLDPHGMIGQRAAG